MINLVNLLLFWLVIVTDQYYSVPPTRSLWPTASQPRPQHSFCLEFQTRGDYFSRYVMNGIVPTAVVADVEAAIAASRLHSVICVIYMHVT